VAKRHLTPTRLCGELWRCKAQGVLKRFRQIEWAYLYGSALRIPDFEDIDLALKPGRKLSDRAKAALETRLYEALSLKLPLDRKITESVREFGIYDLHWLEDLPLPLQFRVIGEGIPVLDRSPSRRIRYEARIFKEYLDFEPTYHRIMDKTLEYMRSRHGPPQ